MPIAESELILNADGSIYHLNLKPQNIADIIITVGDQDRVEMVSKHFDVIDFRTQKREFKTHTGFYKGRKMTVISTGIGTDNIDIVMNELDALANIDFKTRTIKEKLKKLNIVRIGTSGGIHDFVELDKFVMSKYGLGFDGLLHYYEQDVSEKDAVESLKNTITLDHRKAEPYLVKSSDELAELFEMEINVTSGITTTNIGFYAPQGRTLRIPARDSDLIEDLSKYSFNGYYVTNMEMETSAIYALSKLMGHKALAMNAIVANRTTGEFSKNSKGVVEDLILFTLNKLAKLSL
jgi:uridine phosphorylase